MKLLLTTILSLTVLTSNGQTSDIFTKLESCFADSGYAKTNKWIRKNLSDTAGVYKQFLSFKATAYYNDAIGYRVNNDYLSDNTKWTEQFVQFKHSNRCLSYSLIGSRASRFGLAAYQVNTDVYYVINKRFYANADLAFGQGQLYPQYRASFKAYYTGLKGFEFAAGYSYINFTSNPVSMARLSAGMYFSDLYLYAEYLHINTKTNKNYALVMWLRNYLPNAKGYFFINGSAGLQSDRLNSYGDFINSRRISGGINYRVVPRFSMEFAVSTEKQILSEVVSRQLMSINTGLYYHFQLDKNK